MKDIVRIVIFLFFHFLRPNVSLGEAMDICGGIAIEIKMFFCWNRVWLYVSRLLFVAKLTEFKSDLIGEGV